MDVQERICRPGGMVRERGRQCEKVRQGLTEESVYAPASSPIGKRRNHSSERGRGAIPVLPGSPGLEQAS